MERQILQSSLSTHIQQQHYLELHMKIIEEIQIQCIPVSISNNLLMVLKFQDFMPDGFEIVRVDDIADLSYSETCKYFETIVKQEEASTLLRNAPEIILINWQTVFCSLKNLNSIVIVDIGKEDCVNVGKVLDVSENEVSMLCFSPTGV